MEDAGTYHTQSKATVHVALPALALQGFSCLTWDAEIVLPPAFRMNPDSTGDFPPKAVAGLASGAHHLFQVDMPGRDFSTSAEVVRGWFRIKVRNPLADAGVYLATKDGSPLWLYAVRFHVHGSY